MGARISPGADHGARCRSHAALEPQDDRWLLVRDLMTDLETLVDQDASTTDDDLAGLPVLLDPRTSGASNRRRVWASVAL